MNATDEPLRVFAPGEEPATAGNNRAVHYVRAVYDTYQVTACGVQTPRSPQTTQESLPRCKRCFG